MTSAAGFSFTGDPFEQLLRVGKKARGRGDSLVMCCPAHDDQSPSLSVSRSGDKVLVRCHAGCSQEDVISALLRTYGVDVLGGPDHSVRSPSTSSQPVSRRPNPTEARYDYVDGDGRVIGRKCRIDVIDPTARKGHRKEMWWTDSTGRKAKPQDVTLYRRQDLARLPDAIVFLCEGEKTADAIVAVLPNHPAVCAPDGSSTSPATLEACAKLLRDRSVILVPDADRPGRAHMQQFVTALSGSAKRIGWLDPSALGLAPDSSDDFADLVERIGSEAARKALLRAADVCSDATPQPIGPDIKVDDLEQFALKFKDPVPWRIDRLLPDGSLVIISAMAKTGKTSLVIALTRALLTGEPFLGRTTTPAGRVLLVLLEDRGQRVFEELVSYGLIERMPLSGGAPIVPPEFRGRLFIAGPQAFPEGFQSVEATRRLIAEHQPDVLVIDTFNRFVTMHSGRGTGDVNRDALDRLVPFQHLAQETGCVIAFAMHSAKAAGDSTAITATSGAISLVGTADLIITLGKESGKTGPHAPRMLETFCRYGEAVRKHRVTRDPETRRLLFEELGNGGEEPATRHLDDVLRVVRDQPNCSENQLVQCLGIGVGSGRAALLHAVKVGLVRRDTVYTKDGTSIRTYRHTLTEDGAQHLDGNSGGDA